MTIQHKGYVGRKVIMVGYTNTLICCILFGCVWNWDMSPTMDLSLELGTIFRQTHLWIKIGNNVSYPSYLLHFGDLKTLPKSVLPKLLEPRLRRPRVGVPLCVLQFSKEKQHNSLGQSDFGFDHGKEHPRQTEVAVWHHIDSTLGFCVYGVSTHEAIQEFLCFTMENPHLKIYVIWGYSIGYSYFTTTTYNDQLPWFLRMIFFDGWDRCRSHSMVRGVFPASLVDIGCTPTSFWFPVYSRVSSRSLLHTYHIHFEVTVFKHIFLLYLHCTVQEL